MYIEGDSIDDTRMRWDSCVIRINALYFWIERVRTITPTLVELHGSVYQDGGWMPQRTVAQLSEIDTTHPKSGYVNIDKHAYLLIKSAQDRHYKLGFCSRRHSLRVPNSNSLEVIGIYPSQELLEVIPQLFNRSYVSLTEAIRSITAKEKFSVAISNKVALGVSHRTKGIAVYRNNTLIGELDGTTAVLPYNHQYFSEELEGLGMTIKLVEAENGKKAK